MCLSKCQRATYNLWGQSLCAPAGLMTAPTGYTLLARIALARGAGTRLLWLGQRGYGASSRILELCGRCYIYQHVACLVHSKLMCC